MSRNNKEQSQHNVGRQKMSRRVRKGVAITAVAGASIVTVLSGAEFLSGDNKEDKLKAVTVKTTEDINHNKPVKVLKDGKAAIQFKHGAVRFIENPIIDESGAIAERAPSWTSNDKGLQLTFYTEGAKSPINNIAFSGDGNLATERVTDEVVDIKLVKDRVPEDHYHIDGSKGPMPDDVLTPDWGTDIGTLCDITEAINSAELFQIREAKPIGDSAKAPPADYFVNPNLDNLHIAEGISPPPF